MLFSGPDEDVLADAAHRYAEKLEKALREALGADANRDLLLYCASPAPIKRKQGSYRYQILIKLLRTVRTPDTIRCIYAFTSAHASDLFASIEINPQDML